MSGFYAIAYVTNVVLIIGVLRMTGNQIVRDCSKLFKVYRSTRHHFEIRVFLLCFWIMKWTETSVFVFIIETLRTG